MIQFNMPWEFGFPLDNILKFGDKITLENILFVSKSVNRQFCLLYFMIGLYFQEIYTGMKLAGL